MGLCEEVASSKLGLPSTIRGPVEPGGALFRDNEPGGSGMAKTLVLSGPMTRLPTNATPRGPADFVWWRRCGGAKLVELCRLLCNAYCKRNAQGRSRKTNLAGALGIGNGALGAVRHPHSHRSHTWPGKREQDNYGTANSG